MNGSKYLATAEESYHIISILHIYYMDAKKKHLRVRTTYIFHPKNDLMLYDKMGNRKAITITIIIIIATSCCVYARYNVR